MINEFVGQVLIGCAGVIAVAITGMVCWGIYKIITTEWDSLDMKDD